MARIIHGSAVVDGGINTSDGLITLNRQLRRVRARRTTNQSISENTDTTLSLDTTDENIGSWTVAGTGITVPSGVTCVMIEAQVEWLSTNPQANVRVFLELNSGLIIPNMDIRQDMLFGAGVGNWPVQNQTQRVTALFVPVKPSDVIRCRVNQSQVSTTTSASVVGGNDRSFVRIVEVPIGP